MAGSSLAPASIIMLCLGGPNGENYDGVIRMLDVLLSSETSEADKCEKELSL